MSEKEEYDFYRMGQRYAKDEFLIVEKVAEEIGKKYGEEARFEFEMGMTSMIPEYGNRKPVKVDPERVHATTDYGVPNSRNLSYFGAKGTGVQTVEVNGKNVYNEPKKRK